jgi:hypothetical protein
MFTQNADTDYLHIPLCTTRYCFLVNVLPSHEIKRLVLKPVTVIFNADTLSHLNLNVQWIVLFLPRNFVKYTNNSKKPLHSQKKIQSLWDDYHRATIGKFLFQIKNFPPAMLCICSCNFGRDLQFLRQSQGWYILNTVLSNFFKYAFYICSYLITILSGLG